MSERTEKAILAGGCFWGMQDLIRKRPGVLSTRVGYTGGDVPNATYRNHGDARRGDRDHLRPRADLLSRPARVLLPDPRPDDAQPPGQRRRHELPLGDLLRRRRAAPCRRGHDRRRRSLRALAGQGRHRGHARPGRSGRPNPSTRTISSAIPTATRATSRARVGCCRGAARSRLRKRVHRVAFSRRAAMRGTLRATPRRPARRRSRSPTRSASSPSRRRGTPSGAATSLKPRNSMPMPKPRTASRVPVGEQPEVEVERLRPRDVVPRRVARDPDRLHAQLVERLSPVTQELHFVRSGGRPVEEIEDEQLRPVLHAAPPWSRARSARGRPSRRGRGRRRCSTRRRLTATSDPRRAGVGRRSSRRGNSSRMFPTACTREPRRKTHWFAVGQSTSSVVPSGDQTTSPNVPGAREEQARATRMVDVDELAPRSARTEPHRDGELVRRAARNADVPSVARSERRDRPRTSRPSAPSTTMRRRRRDREEPPVVRPFERARREVGRGAASARAPVWRRAGRSCRCRRRTRRVAAVPGSHAGATCVAVRVEQLVAAPVAATTRRPLAREVRDARVGQRALPSAATTASRRARASSARRRPRRGRAAAFRVVATTKSPCGDHCASAYGPRRRLKPLSRTSQTPPSSVETTSSRPGARQREERRLGVLDADRLAHALEDGPAGRRRDATRRDGERSATTPTDQHA